MANVVLRFSQELLPCLNKPQEWLGNTLRIGTQRYADGLAIRNASVWLLFQIQCLQIQPWNG